MLSPCRCPCRNQFCELVNISVTKGLFAFEQCVIIKVNLSTKVHNDYLNFSKFITHFLTHIWAYKCSIFD